MLTRCSSLLIGGLMCVSLMFAQQPQRLLENRKNTPVSRPVQTAQKQQEPPKEPKHKYPLLNSVLVGIDLFSPVANLFGQKYGNYEASVELDLHNRFFPIWEIGIGQSNSTPEDMNFTYIGKPALYNRIGLNYNIKYNSLSSDYFYIGLRYGFSAFHYDIKNIHLDSPYWNPDSPVTAEILNQKSRAQWVEGLLGVRMKIYKGLMMGWSVRYKWKIKVKDNFQSSPWFIPGFGNSGSSVAFTYSIYYKLPLSFKNKKTDKPLTQ